MEAHPEKGARILEPLTAYAPVVPIVLQHHERLDGTGYPNGLEGDDICIAARILAVADVYDALVSERPYRAPWNHRRAMDFICERRKRLFDTNVVEAFLEIMTSRDGWARATDGDVAELLLDVAPGSRSFCLQYRPTLFERK
jgi:HD-GYP domain-containing protein (c-di-GMP phosphodiesterase class II)